MAPHHPAPQPYGDPPLSWPHYGIGFGGAVRRYLAKYASFRGRASRGEYWWTVLLNVLVLVVYSTLLQAAGGLAPGAVGANPTANTVLNVFRLYFLGVLVPNVSVQVRRLHDAGRSGWWSLLNLLPLVGQIVLVVLCLADTSPKAERYGPPAESQPPQDGRGQTYGSAPPYGAAPPQESPSAHGAPPVYFPPAPHDGQQTGTGVPPAPGTPTADGPPPEGGPGRP